VPDFTLKCVAFFGDDPADWGKVRKIFISYRRQDTAASALGIGQYLEREFGGKNVFIDVDIRAGAKFPAVLEMRIAECKVLLALIGPGWLNALDEKGRRRLDDPNDWVRLEIARALNRNVTVIPVRVEGAELPRKADLPEDIRGLVDHQAAVVTTEGFRNEMAGLVRDIRAIPSPWPWGRIGASAAAALALLLGGWFSFSYFGPSLSRTPSVTQRDKGTDEAETVPSDKSLRGSISLRSEPGDYIGQGESWNLTEVDGKFTATVAKKRNGVSITFQGDDRWDLEFVAPEGKRIELGTYNTATRAPFNSPTKPGLSISGAGRGCNKLTGRFDVRQIAYSKSDDGIERFIADFEQHCEGAKPALAGTVEVSTAGG
jgi:hypothetical protein